MSDQDLDKRLTFLHLDADAIQRLRSIEPIVSETIPAALDNFYRHILSFPETRRFFASEGQIAGAKGRQSAHWNRIANGKLDAEYVRAVNTIGQVHARIGLEPRWYIGGYAAVVTDLIAALVRARWPEQEPAGRFFSRKTARADQDDGDRLAAEISVLVRVAMLDMDYSISVYLDEAEKARVAAEAATLASERRLVSETVGSAMTQLANGDLTTRLPNELPSEYGDLRNNFNVAMTTMEKAVGAVVDSSVAIKASASEVSAASNDLAQRTEEQSNSLQSAAATTEQLAASVKANADASRQAKMTADHARSVAEGGGDVARRAVEAMALIEAASVKISDITSVIEGIAFQTNLLALNAAVEAARAGDAGKGFAVVASEVRTLAQRSSEASKDISQLIAASSAQISEGVGLVRSTGETLAEIVTSARSVATAVAEISSASAEQGSGIEDMSNTVANMDGVTQQNAALAEQSAAAGLSLVEQAERLDRAVAAFKLSRRAVNPGLTNEAPISGTAPRGRQEPVQREAQPLDQGRIRRVANTGARDGWADF
ncbi:MAG: methyl-accepting chemotaxis protein [Proteobacteria bacterium]|nr:methyl-accepting chemotaxis protein [Pseudomonadota bacterium]